MSQADEGDSFSQAHVFVQITGKTQYERGLQMFVVQGAPKLVKYKHAVVGYRLAFDGAV